jgi:hypothetical protein
MDSQANSSKVLLSDYAKLDKDQTIFTTIIDRKPLVVLPTYLPTLDIVPSEVLPMVWTRVNSNDVKEARGILCVSSSIVGV